VKFRLSIFISVGLLFGSLGAQTKPPQKDAAECGPLSNQTLHCLRFGFTYKVPFGWVDRTVEMNTDSQSANNSGNSGSQSNTPSSAGSETLLAAFERPPGSPGDTIDSAVIIAAEPMTNYHGIKTAADYFGAISELADRRGFNAEKDPYIFSIGMKRLVRGDFSKHRGNLTMYQTSLALLDKGYFLSFTLVAGSEDEVEQLVDNLSFGTSGHRKRSH
jgi:hypothetical protein